MSARHAFLRELIDDAGLFPPASLTLEQALERHLRAREGPYGWMLGHFVVPVLRLQALCEQGKPVSASVVLNGSDLASDRAVVDACLRLCPPTVRIAALELRLPQRACAAAAWGEVEALPSEIPAFIEIPWGDPTFTAQALAALAGVRKATGTPLCAKLRCGGELPGGTPAPTDVAFFLARAREFRVPCKLTAGLHAPWRHFDASKGVAVHGFLNVVGAALLSFAHDLSLETMTELLLDENSSHFMLDDARFAWGAYEADAGCIAQARASFVRGFGNCDFGESVEHLVNLGILGEGA